MSDVAEANGNAARMSAMSRGPSPIDSSQCGHACVRSQFSNSDSRIGLSTQQMAGVIVHGLCGFQMQNSFAVLRVHATVVCLFMRHHPHSVTCLVSIDRWTNDRKDLCSGDS